MAIGLLLRVEEATGVRLPVSSFFQEPNLAGLLSMVKAKSDDVVGNLLLAWQPSGRKAPLYCLHGFGGDVLEYSAMAKGIDPDRPVFAVRSASALEGKVPAGSLEAVAEQVADSIANHRPGSPRILVGYSWAGLLAYEAALHLFKREQVFPTVILIDSTAPLFELRIMERILYFLRQTPGWLLRTRLRGIIRVSRRTLLGKTGRGNRVPPATEHPLLSIIEKYRARKEPRLEMHLIRASHRDEMTPLHSDIHVVWRDNGWHRATHSKILKYSLPCNHLELMHEPMASILAKRVSEISDFAERNSPIH
jgi:thioesterase domain-containing protein